MLFRRICLPIAVVLFLAAPQLANPAQEETTYDIAKSGMRCSQNRTGDLECEYRIGQSLHFAIVAPGKPDGSIYFYSSLFEGDYFAVLGISSAYGCVVIRPGKSVSEARRSDLAFVSLQNGKVYRQKEECAKGE